MSEIIMRRTSQGFVPADQHQYEELLGDRIALGELCKVKISKPRNLEFHRLYFAMIRATFEMQDEFESEAVWRAVCQTGAGYCEFAKGKDGQMVAIPKSIAFGKMDETEFRRLKDDVLTFICGRYINGTPEELDTILQFA